jgi:hypothetical protein
MKQLIATNNKRFPLLYNEEELFGLWCRCHRQFQFHYEDWVYLDQETSDKIRELQKRTQDKINQLMIKNFHKSRVITEEDMKNYKAE